MTVYVTYNRFDLSVQYIGTDKEAALDARQCVDDLTYQQSLTIERDGEDFRFTLRSVVAPQIEQVVTVRDGKPRVVDRITFPAAGAEVR